MKRIVTSSLVVLTQICLAQSSSQMVGAGYDFPRKYVAPGQVVTFWIAGAKTVFPLGQQLRTATIVPLPTSLAGFSVSFEQTSQALLPIFSVQQLNLCPDQGARPSCTLTGITAQLPMDMVTCFRCEADRPPRVSIAIIENGTRTDLFGFFPLPDSIHILTDCDSISLNPNGLCLPKITHADGTLLAYAPIQVGESLTMYAVGLGVTDPRVPAGTVTTGPAPLAYVPPTIQYSYLIDPSAPAGSATSAPVAPVITYAGLAPGQVGIYQVNFVVPAPPGNAMGCNQPATQTNLTVSLVGSSSVDSAKICVKLPDKVATGHGSSHTSGPSPHAPDFRRP